MQYSRQKKREIRTDNAAAKGGGGAAHTTKGREEIARQSGETVGPAIGEGGFREGPDPLVGVQFGRVGRQELKVEARNPVTQPVDRGPFVDASIVPEHDDRPPQVPEEMAEELTDFGLVDIGSIHAVVEAEVPALRTDRDP